jgi:hypothetical protein
MGHLETRRAASVVHPRNERAKSKTLWARLRALVVQASFFCVLACTSSNDSGGTGGAAAVGQGGGAGVIGTAGSGGSSGNATGGVTSGGSSGVSGAAGASGTTAGTTNAGAAGMPPMGGAAGEAGTGGMAGTSGTGGASGVGGTAGMSGASGMAGSAGAAGMGVTLVSTINLRGASGCPGMRLGDINGDGRMDIVVGQGVDQNTLGSYTPQRVAAVTAFDLKGAELWQYGTPNNSHIASSDIPIQVYDMDGDGRSEIFAAMSTTELTVLNGMNGQVLRRIPIPSGSNDSIAFANLRGTDWPQDILVKTRYSQYWAITGVDSDRGPAGTVLWTLNKGPASGDADLGPGHYALVYDWNADGRDEVMAGYDFLNSSGQIQWSVTSLGLHADTIFTGNMDANAANGYEIVVCGDYAAAYEWQTGRRIWQNSGTVEIQQGGMGDYRKDVPGLEVALLDRLRTSELGLKSNNYLYDARGNLLQQENRPNDSGWLTVTENLNNWDGLGNDFIFSYRREEGVLLYDGNLRTVATFPYTGSSPENFAQHADLCGDAREEVIVYDETTAWIYANGGCDLDAPPRTPSLPQQYHLYNWSIYTGWITPDVKFFTPGSMQ